MYFSLYILSRDFYHEHALKDSDGLLQQEGNPHGLHPIRYHVEDA